MIEREGSSVGKYTNASKSSVKQTQFREEQPSETKPVRESVFVQLVLIYIVVYGILYIFTPSTDEAQKPPICLHLS